VATSVTTSRSSNLSIVLASAAVAAVAATGPLAASAQAEWKKLGCAPTEVNGARICIYRDKQITNFAMYKFINHSSLDLKHITRFWRYNSSTVVTCGGLTTTTAGHTKTCTSSLAPGRWYAAADTWKGDEYLGFTATDVFRFGQN
jgi:hypothetical protein